MNLGEGRRARPGARGYGRTAAAGRGVHTRTGTLRGARDAPICLITRRPGPAARAAPPRRARRAPAAPRSCPYEPVVLADACGKTEAPAQIQPEHAAPTLCPRRWMVVPPFQSAAAAEPARQTAPAGRDGDGARPSKGVEPVLQARRSQNVLPSTSTTCGSQGRAWPPPGTGADRVLDGRVPQIERHASRSAPGRLATARSRFCLPPDALRRARPACAGLAAQRVHGSRYVGRRMRASTLPVWSCTASRSSAPTSGRARTPSLNEESRKQSRGCACSAAALAAINANLIPDVRGGSCSSAAGPRTQMAGQRGQ